MSDPEMTGGPKNQRPFWAEWAFFLFDHSMWLIAAIVIDFKITFSPLLPLAIGGAAVFLLGLIDDLFNADFHR